MTETETPTALDHDLNRACDMFMRSPENARQTVIRQMLELHHKRMWKAHTCENALAEIANMKESAAREDAYAKSLHAAIPVGPGRVRYEGPCTVLAAAEKHARERVEQLRIDVAEAEAEVRKMQDERAEAVKALTEWEAFYRDCWPDDGLMDLTPYVRRAYGALPGDQPDPDPF